MLQRLVTLVVFLSLVAALVWVAQGSSRVVQSLRNERAAVASLRKINSAQAAYAAECGRGNYATSLMDLATRPPDKPEGYLSWRRGDLGWSITSPVQGYLFTIWPGQGAKPGAGDCNEFPTQTTYYAIAVAGAQGVTGIRSFAANQDGIVWERFGLPPPAEPFGPPSRPAP